MKKFILSTITINLLVISMLSFGFMKTALAAEPGANSGNAAATGQEGGGLDAKKAACEGVELAGGSGCGTTDSTSENKVKGVVKTVINVFSIIVGVTSVIMIMIGGFKYITSQGDSNNINSAKNTILYAVIGLIVVTMAQVIVKFVLMKVG